MLSPVSADSMAAFSPRPSSKLRSMKCAATLNRWGSVGTAKTINQHALLESLRPMLRAFTAAALLTPHTLITNAVLLAESGRIRAVGPRGSVELPPHVQIEDYGKDIIAPGYIDLHIHGSAGHDVMQASEDGRATMERFLLAHGVTSYFPTTVSAPVDVTLRALE